MMRAHPRTIQNPLRFSVFKHSEFRLRNAGESETFQDGLESLRELGIDVIDIDSAECKQLLVGFIHAHPEIWNEDIGVD
jgi:hypothetical protein